MPLPSSITEKRKKIINEIEQKGGLLKMENFEIAQMGIWWLGLRNSVRFIKNNGGEIVSFKDEHFIFGLDVFSLFVRNFIKNYREYCGNKN